MFANTTFVFVPADRQIAIYSEAADRGTDKPLVMFYQVNITNPTYEVQVGSTTLGLEGEFRLAEPTPDVMKDILATIAENIAPYLVKGVISSEKTLGEISFHQDNGVWFMTRGQESITINNKHHVPDDDCDYWIAFTHGCTHCDSAPDFEFMGIDASVLIIPEGVTLAEHLRPFIQTIQSELRRERQENHPLAGLLDGLPFGERLRGKMKSHVDEVGEIVAGVGEYYIGSHKGEVGGIKIDGRAVLALHKDHAVVMGKRIDIEADENPVDVDGKIVGITLQRIEKMMHIPLTDITPELFSRQVMRKVTTKALENDYDAIDGTDVVQHQLFGIIQSAAIPGKANWWLRVLANAWLMHMSYPLSQTHDQVSRQVKEIARHLDIDEAETVEIRFRLRDVVNGWAE